jgi:hypothetical protein
LHELRFLPFHECALGVVGSAFGLAGFFGDLVKFFERDGSGERGVIFAVRFVVSAFGPGGWNLGFRSESPGLGLWASGF